MKPASMKQFAAEVTWARKLRHMTVRTMADQIGISESALRRIENGTSRKTRGETWFAILQWASRRGYKTFAGWPLTINEPSAEEAQTDESHHREHHPNNGSERNPLQTLGRNDGARDEN
jgi:transcriptional regulator with XRE-family HTH domain